MALGPAAEATLRRLEAWAQEETPSLAEAEQREDRRYIARRVDDRFDLVAFAPEDAPEEAMVPVRSMFELEQVAAEAERKMRGADVRAAVGTHVWLQEQQRCCQALMEQIESTAAQLQHEASRCSIVRRESEPVIAQFEETVRKQQQDYALKEALEAHLRPLKEARAVAGTLDSVLYAGGATHSEQHPLVVALATFDGSLEHLSEHVHWRDSSAQLAEVHAMRCRALRAIASQQITRALGGLTAQLLAQRSAAVASDASNTLARRTSTDGAAAAHGVVEAESGGMLEGAAASDANGAAAGLTSAEAAAAMASTAATAADVRFQSLAMQLRPWIQELERRAEGADSHDECRVILQDTRRDYWQHRSWLAQNNLREALGRVNGEEEAADAVVRRCCAYALQVCRAEEKLHRAFFGAAPASETAEALATLCYPLYDELHPLVLRQQSLDPLCEVIHVLRAEVLGETLAGHGAAAAALEPMLLQLLADTRERLTYRVQTYVRDEIRGFDHSRAKQLIPPGAAAPAAVSGSNDVAAGVEAEERAASPSDAGATSSAATIAGGSGGGSGDTKISSRWYPTLQAALECLAKVYTCLPRSVFDGLAQEVLSECTSSLLTAGARLRAVTSPLHQTLFVISQLLALREQIAPFDTDFAITRKALDFSHTRQMLRQLVERRRWMGGVHAVVELLQQGAPSVIESQEDAKVRLERELKSACEELILGTSNRCAKPLLALLPSRDGDAATSTPSSRSTMPSDAALEAAFKEAERGMTDAVEEGYRLLCAYLPDSSTQAILFGPIKSNLLEAFGQLQTLFNALGQQTPYEQRLSALASRLDALGVGDRPYVHRQGHSVRSPPSTPTNAASGRD